MSEHEFVSYLRDLYDNFSRTADIQPLIVNTWDLSEEVNGIVSSLHPEIMKRYYGSGMVIPDDIRGLTVLDIGCGSGSLTFTLSKLIGPEGRIIGIDLSPYQITICKMYEDYHRDKWGFEQANTEFHEANAEDLSQFGDQSFDVIVSNGTMTLPPDRKKAFGEVFRLLKEGGELYISETYTNKAPPIYLLKDKDLWDSGITASFVVKDFATTLRGEGFTKPYLTGVSTVKVDEKYNRIPDLGEYCTANYRMFRLNSASRTGSARVTYTGPCDQFRWDVNHVFKRGDVMFVDRELADIFTYSRYKKMFEVTDNDNAKNSDSDRQNTFTNLIYDPFEYLARLEKDIQVPLVYTMD